MALFRKRKAGDLLSIFPYVQVSTCLDDCVCETCREMEGKIFHARKAPHLPFHEGCRCAYLHLTAEDVRRLTKE